MRKFLRRIFGIESKELQEEIDMLSEVMHTYELIFKRIDDYCEFYINANNYSKGQLKGQYTNLQRCGLRKIKELIEEEVLF